jgi:DMSO/TMAO reductase YedYZ heme-binding membrane subunit
MLLGIGFVGSVAGVIGFVYMAMQIYTHPFWMPPATVFVTLIAYLIAILTCMTCAIYSILRMVEDGWSLPIGRRW